MMDGDGAFWVVLELIAARVLCTAPSYSMAGLTEAAPRLEKRVRACG